MPTPSGQASLEAQGQSSSLQFAEQCEGYRGVPNVFGYCLTKVASMGHGKETVQEVCADAGDWARDCRHAWATSRTHTGHTDRFGRIRTEQLSDEVLLEACQDDDDCRFAILDARPADDVVEQLNRCAAHAGEFTHDCTIHALDRWVRTFPDAGDAQRVAQVAHHPEEIGRYVAILVSCHEVGECTGSEEATASCREAIQEIDETFCEKYAVRDHQTPPPTRTPLPEGAQPPRAPGLAPPDAAGAPTPPAPPREIERPVPTGPPGGSPTGG